MRRGEDRRLRRMVGALAVAGGLVLAGGACSDDEPTTAGPVTTGPVTAGPVTTGPVTTGPGTTASGEVTIRATVLSVFASAGVLRLDPPVAGYSSAAVGPSTEYRRADGTPGSLQDVADGSTVEVTGEAGAPGSLIARLVVVVG